MGLEEGEKGPLVTVTCPDGRRGRGSDRVEGGGRVRPDNRLSGLTGRGEGGPPVAGPVLLGLGAVGVLAPGPLTAHS